MKTYLSWFLVIVMAVFIASACSDEKSDKDKDAGTDGGTDTASSTSDTTDGTSDSSGNASDTGTGSDDGTTDDTGETTGSNDDTPDDTGETTGSSDDATTDDSDDTSAPDSGSVTDSATSADPDAGTDDVDMDGGDDMDGGTATDTAAVDAGVNACPATVPDDNLQDNDQPSCSDIEELETICTYEEVACVCDGPRRRPEDWVWECFACPNNEPDDEDDCDIGGLACSYGDVDCTCEQQGGGYDGEWSCVSNAAQEPTDTVSTYTCPATIPDDDIDDNDEPSCANEAENRVNCPYDDVSCVCGGARDQEDMVWQCHECPEPGDQPDDGDECPAVGLICDYTQESCECVRDGTDREWECD